MAKKSGISISVIKRLPRYYRFIGELVKQGTVRISSGELAEKMSLTASQIRQDLNCFGGFGQQGYGYNVKYLYGKISELLGVHENYTTVIIGAGNLGKALASTHMFERRGILRLAMFDNDERIVGTEIFGLPVLHIDTLEAFCAINHVDFAVLTTPWEAAPAIAERLSKSGVRGIWNFSNMELASTNKDMIIENIHFSDSLMKLCFDLKKASEESKETEEA